MFELTPQHPAILDGTSTFQLLLWQGCVRGGNRIKVHVEAASGRGGEQVRCGPVRCGAARRDASDEGDFAMHTLLFLHQPDVDPPLCTG